MKRIILVLMVFLSPFIFHLSPLFAYTNPILPYDFSDPDVIRLGKYYYMTFSSFASTPGLQILRSEDVVHWEYADAVLPDTIPGYGHSGIPTCEGPKFYKRNA
jgi:beta-xylosidase